MALKRDGVAFNPFFQNRLNEIKDNLKQVEGLVDVLVSPRKIEGGLNPADINTRDHAKPEDLLPGSLWHKGPQFLRQPREDWPLTDVDEKEVIPD